MKALTPKWSIIECSYIKAAKHVFQLIRAEQETHCYYFYDRRLGHRISLVLQLCHGHYVLEWRLLHI